MDQGGNSILQALIQAQTAGWILCVSKDENEGIFDDDIREDSRGQKTLTRLKEYNIKSAINNWASSWNEIETKTFKNAWNKLISNEELESDLEGKEEDVHGAFVANPSDVRAWLKKVEEGFRY
jgi:transcriptional accessory protein Tex/SPT6